MSVRLVHLNFLYLCLEVFYVFQLLYNIVKLGCMIIGNLSLITERVDLPYVSFEISGCCVLEFGLFFLPHVV
jgi:hypothetical protein